MHNDGEMGPSCGSLVSFHRSVRCMAVGLHGGRPRDLALFEVTIESQADMTIAPTTQKIVSTTTLRYTLIRRGPEVTVVFDEVRIKMTNNGAEMMNSTMNATKAGFSKEGKLQEVRVADAPEGLKRMLSDSFGRPVCKVTLGEDGGEIKRTIVAGPGARGSLIAA